MGPGAVIGEAVLNLLTAGLRSYNKQKREKKLNNEIERLAAKVDKYAAAYDTLRQAYGDKSERLAQLELKYAKLSGDFDDVCQELFESEVKLGRRELDDNPYTDDVGLDASEPD